MVNSYGLLDTECFYNHDTTEAKTRSIIFAFTRRLDLEQEDHPKLESDIFGVRTRYDRIQQASNIISGSCLIDRAYS